MLKARDFRQQAWKKLSGNWAVAVIAVLLLGLIVGALSFTWVGPFIISGPLTLGVAIIVLKIVRGEKPEITNLFDGFSDFVRSLILYIINTIFVALWSLLFVIPGIIKHYSYSMSFYILKDNPELTANEARIKSMEMMNGNKWRLFCLDFSFIGWILLSMLTFGILMFWVSPYMEVAHAEFYQSLLPAPAEAPEQLPAPDAE